MLLCCFFSFLAGRIMNLGGWFGQGFFRERVLRSNIRATFFFRVASGEAQQVNSFGEFSKRSPKMASLAIFLGFLAMSCERCPVCVPGLIDPVGLGIAKHVGDSAQEWQVD